MMEGPLHSSSSPSSLHLSQLPSPFRWLPRLTGSVVRVILAKIDIFIESETILELRYSISDDDETEHPRARIGPSGRNPDGVC